MDAIHEMFMKSFDGDLRILPTMPESWKDAQFKGLRAEGGFRVCTGVRYSPRNTRFSLGVLA